jgi:hypothetical protein
MTPHSRELITRLQESYLEYFDEIPDDRLLSYSINPLLVTLGAYEIKSLMDADGNALIEKSKSLLNQHVVRMMWTKIEERATSPSVPDVVVEEGLFSDTQLCFNWSI